MHLKIHYYDPYVNKHAANTKQTNICYQKATLKLCVCRKLLLWTILCTLTHVVAC